MFARFPGIGPRQAKRFVYYLLSRNGSSTEELVKAIQELKREIAQCERCMRHFSKNGHASKLCSVCSDPNRDMSRLCVVPRDIDLDAIEKSGGFNGLYFVLGGAVPILEKDPEKRVRIKNLESRIKNDKDIKEVILAMNANAEGENTADFIKERLKESGKELTVLGRGLSTGAELEYADPETLKSAFQHRTK